MAQDVVRRVKIIFNPYNNQDGPQVVMARYDGDNHYTHLHEVPLNGTETDEWVSDNRDFGLINRNPRCVTVNGTLYCP